MKFSLFAHMERIDETQSQKQLANESHRECRNRTWQANQEIRPAEQEGDRPTVSFL